jgi:hypothetical protein
MNIQYVVIKDFTNESHLKVVCYANENSVFVTSEKAFKQIKSGQSHLFPIGFPRRDVFIYDGQNLTPPIDWGTMKPWNDSYCRDRLEPLKIRRGGFTRKN